MAVRAVCPACKAEVREGSRACPRCGGSLPRARSAAAGVPSEAAGIEGGGVPDLVLPGSPASAGSREREGDRKTSRSAVAVAAPSTAVDPNLMDADDLGGGEDDVKLDLDVGPAAAPSARAVAARVSAPRGTETAALVPSAGAPSTSTPAALDPFEVRAVADYGPRPRHWWETPRYAYRVLTRKAELRRAIALRRAEAERAETAAEDALIAFGQRARAVAEALPPSAASAAYVAALQEVAATEDLFRARDTALSAETQAHEQRRAESVQQIGDMEAQLAARRAEEDAIAAELAAVEAVVKRAEARVKRAEIEIRNAGQLQGTQGPESRRGPS